MREILALVLIILLVFASVWNINSVEKLSQDIQSHLNSAKEAIVSENPDAAYEAIDKALSRWLNAEKYTHIFIRHPEIDSCSDVFYDLKEAIFSSEATEIQAIISKLCYHLNSIADMEKVRIGSIL